MSVFADGQTVARVAVLVVAKERTATHTVVRRIVKH